MNKRYEFRSMHLDCARHFFSAETVKKVILGISFGEINTLHWHLSDDHGWRIESRKFPRLHECSGEYYTQQEIRDIVAYAKVHGIEVIPEIDMPGHTLALLSAYPQYSCKGEPVTPAKARGIYRTILCAGKSQTISFVEELLEEIIPLFDSAYFHIGGDEAPKDEWKECPHCNATMQKLGISSYEDLQGYFIGQVCAILKRHGKTPICWNDALLASHLPEEAVVQYWSMDYAKEMKDYVSKGGKWIYSDMFELYLDYPHSMIPLKKIYEFQPHLDAEKIPNEDGLIGFETCVWTEHIDNEKDLCEHIFPRVFAISERIAGEQHTDYESFKARVREKIQLLEKAQIPYTKEAWWDPQGADRRRDALRFYFAMGKGVDEEEKKKQAVSAAPTKAFVLRFIREFYKLSDLPSFVWCCFKDIFIVK